MPNDVIDLVIKVASVLGLCVPAVALVYEVVRFARMRKFAIKDEAGHVLAEISAETLLKEDPQKLETIRQEVHRRVAHGTRAA